MFTYEYLQIDSLYVESINGTIAVQFHRYCEVISIQDQNT